MFRHGVAFGRPEFKWLKEPQRGPIKKIRIDGYSNNGKEMGRPIRKDIREELLSKYPRCIVCGCSSSLIIDHKNDLYNDPRVLNSETQIKDDFQVLCNHCNLQKRQVSVRTRETGKRQPASQISSVAIFGYDFIDNRGTDLDIKDPTAMVGTYWYDPIAFMNFVKINLR